jgi:hypothetical protein
VASGWNILAGFAGQISLGHASYFGIGAYASAILYRHYASTLQLGLPPFLAMPIAAAFAAFALPLFAQNSPPIIVQQPYFYWDPPTNNILEEKFQDNFTKDNGWASVSGTWEYTDRGLECGKPSEYQDAIFLSPLSGRNFSS